MSPIHRYHLINLMLAIVLISTVLAALNSYDASHSAQAMFPLISYWLVHYGDQNVFIKIIKFLQIVAHKN